MIGRSSVKDSIFLCEKKDLKSSVLILTQKVILVCCVWWSDILIVKSQPKERMIKVSLTKEQDAVTSPTLGATPYWGLPRPT